jgi:hypothetical protein
MYALVCIKLGLSVADLNEISMGLVFDMIAVSGDDYYDTATQADFDNF